MPQPIYVELRTYTCTPGGAAEYLRIYNELGRAVHVQILGNPLGVYQTEVGDLNQIVFLWGFDSLDDRQQRRRTLMADAAFAHFRKSTRGLVVRQENSILVPL